MYRRSERRALGAFALGALAVLAAVAVAVAVVLAVSHRGGIGSLLSSKSGSGAAGAADPKLLARTRVVSMPHRDVGNATERLVVTLSGKPAAGSPHPRLTPGAPGSWSAEGDSEVFRSAAALSPCSAYRLTVPAGTTAVQHSRLGRARTIALHVACPPVRGLQQALARLGYLPDSLHPAPGASAQRGQMDPRRAAHLVYQPIPGRLRPDLAGAPPLQYGVLDATTKGAVMVFQEDHQIEVTGEAGPQTWKKLLRAVAHKYRDPRPYTFVTVTESLPETLQVHKGSRVALTSAANTGVPGAATEQGIFPIFERLTYGIMKGEDVGGAKYEVGVHWINYFNGGDAVHSYERPGYGYPQSNGCVELPMQTGQVVYGMLQLGDIVWVT